jgi:hypothetical protein
MYSKNSLKRFSGWAFIFGAIIFSPWLIVTMLVDARYIYFNTTLNPVYDLLSRLMLIGFFLIGPILLASAMLTLRAGYGQDTGTLGRITLLIGGIGGISALVFVIGSERGGEIFFTLFFFSLVTMFTCLALFGIAAIRHKVLPRLNWLPLLGILWFPLIALVMGEYQPSFGSTIFNIAIIAGQAALAIALILIGTQILLDIRGQQTKVSS